MRAEARWADAMRLALDEARAALATADVPIGAVVLSPHGEVVGRGRNEREARADPTAHAEVLALRRASERLGSWRLEGCTLVVTLERPASYFLSLASTWTLYPLRKDIVEGYGDRWTEASTIVSNGPLSMSK